MAIHRLAYHPMPRINKLKNNSELRTELSCSFIPGKRIGVSVYKVLHVFTCNPQFASELLVNWLQLGTFKRKGGPGEEELALHRTPSADADDGVGRPAGSSARRL
jgi:hypothetical protein